MFFFIYRGRKGALSQRLHGYLGLLHRQGPAESLLYHYTRFKCLNMHFHDFFYTCWNYRVLQTSSETSCSSLGRRNADHQTKGTPVSPSISSPDFSSDALSREILQLYLCFPIFYLYTSTSLLGQIKRNNITPEMFIFPVKILICYYVPQGLSWGNCAHL